MQKLGFVVVVAALATGCQWGRGGTAELIPDPFSKDVVASVQPDPRAFGVPQDYSNDHADVDLAHDRSQILPKFDFAKAPAEAEEGAEHGKAEAPGAHEKQGPHDVTGTGEQKPAGHEEKHE